jgi:hypothetical protein
MKRLTAIIGCAALVLAGAAQAKGPDKATINGPGLEKPVALSGDSESNNMTASPFSRFVQDAGFFPAVFQREPNPMLAGRPAGALGPRYAVVYRVPGPDRRFFGITQDLYPYAAGGPVTYTLPGQPLFGTKSVGGWFRGSAGFKARLVALGLPAKALRRAR